MNEKIDLTKILKDCPKHWKFYSPLCGEVEFIEICDNNNGYHIRMKDGFVSLRDLLFTKEGFYFSNEGAECLLFPSKDQRDWSKFTAPWYKKEKFDPNTLKSFDRVLVRDYNNMEWSCDILSHIKQEDPFPYVGIGSEWKCCIPYNDETKHLVGTTDGAPEFYRHWED